MKRDWRSLWLDDFEINLLCVAMTCAGIILGVATWSL